ncbi:hypothetical protein [Parvicella tangerina]|nr:hypothetical protein [Parvicella tangerina]
MDILDEIKQIDELLSQHTAHQNESTLMAGQYKARKEQLLVYFINELNASNAYQTHRLGLIKQMMERFYPTSEKESSAPSITDEDLHTLAQAISA